MIDKKVIVIGAGLAGFCILNITQAKAAIIGAKTTIVLSILVILFIYPISYLLTANIERIFNFLFHKLRIVFLLFKLK